MFSPLEQQSYDYARMLDIATEEAVADTREIMDILTVNTSPHVTDLASKTAFKGGEYELSINIGNKMRKNGEISEILLMEAINRRTGLVRIGQFDLTNEKIHSLRTLLSEGGQFVHSRSEYAYFPIGLGDLEEYNDLTGIVLGVFEEVDWSNPHFEPVEPFNIVYDLENES